MIGEAVQSQSVQNKAASKKNSQTKNNSDNNSKKSGKGKRGRKPSKTGRKSKKSKKEVEEELLNRELLEHCRGKSVILLDEVDVMIYETNGFLRSLTNLLRAARIPIILTSNYIPAELDAFETHWNKQIFDYAGTNSIVLRCYCICLAEGYCISFEELKNIVSFCKLDLRQILNYLQFWMVSPRTFEHLPPNCQGILLFLFLFFCFEMFCFFLCVFYFAYSVMLLL